MARLIDADALLKRVQECIPVGIFGRQERLACAEGLINSAPTLSPDDVRGVGKWIDCPSTHIQDGAKYKMCSVCNEHIAVLGHDLDYCPYCGARMKGDKNGTTD